MKRNWITVGVSAALFAVAAVTLGGQGAFVGGAGDEGADERSGVIEKKALRRYDVPAPVGPEAAAPPTGQAVPQYGIKYHLGPVMLGTVNVYYIWYGTWNTNTKALLTTLAQSIGGSPYWNINTTYTNGAGTKLSNSVAYKTSVLDNYSLGKNLTDANIRSIVSAKITSGQLPKDPKGVYFVLTAPDVTATSGFCTQYCGWHTHATIGGVDIKYSFVGSVSRCPSSCAAQNPGPNGDVNADGGASILLHELEEAATDPDLNAWYDTSGAENADKCAWTFGTTTGSTPSKYNMTLGGKNWLIQQNWVNVAPSGKCAKSF